MPIHSTFIRYFDEVCRSGAIRKAAGNLHVSYSAISRQISNVENELGISLLKRNASGVKLTRAGELLHQHIERTLQDAHCTTHEIQAIKQRTSGKIIIIAQESIIDRFLPVVLTSLYARFPDIATEIKTANGKKLIERLFASDVDIAIAFDPKLVQGVKIVASQKLSVGAVLSSEHDLAKNNTLTLLECMAYPLILPDKTWPLRDIIDDLTCELGLTPNIMYSSNSVEFLRKMLENKDYVGFQTIVGIESQLERGKLVHIPLYSKELITQNLSLCIRDNAISSDALKYTLSLLTGRINGYSLHTDF